MSSHRWNDTDPVGAWRLVDYVAVDERGECVARPLGESPKGILIYTDDGFMSAQVIGSGDDPGLASWESSDNSKEWSEIYLGYGGTYEWHGDHVIHYAELGSIAEMNGLKIYRSAELFPGELVLRAAASSAGWHSLVLTWRRAPIAT